MCHHVVLVPPSVDVTALQDRWLLESRSIPTLQSAAHVQYVHVSRMSLVLPIFSVMSRSVQVYEAVLKIDSTTPNPLPAVSSVMIKSTLTVLVSIH